MCSVFPAYNFAGLENIYSYCISCCCRVFFILCPLAWISCLRDPELINFPWILFTFQVQQDAYCINIAYVQVFAGKDVRLSTCFEPKLSFEISKLEIWYLGGFGKSLRNLCPRSDKVRGCPVFVYSRYPCPSPFSNQGIRNTCRRCGTGRDGVLKKMDAQSCPHHYPIVAGRLHQQILQGAIRAIRWSC